MATPHTIPLGHASETGPAQRGFAVTPADEDLAVAARFLYNGVALALLKVTTVGGDELTLANVPAGMVLPVSVKRVWSTGTSGGSAIVGFY